MLSGKRQRRQAAALVVQSLWSSTANNNNNNNNSNSKKKVPAGDTAKNIRPVLEVAPMGIGPIREPNANDVLCGRGGLINGSVGNIQFRTIVSTKKKEYNAKSTKRNEKAHMAAEIVRHIRSMNPPGRFLREDANGIWWDIGDARAIRKTGQALREAAPTIRQALDGTPLNDDNNNNHHGEDDKLSDTGSDEGARDAPSTTSAVTKVESPKRKKEEAAPETATKKDGKTKKESVPKSSHKPSSATTLLESVAPVSPTPSAVNSKPTRSSWLPGRRNHEIAAETTRTSQSYLIPTAALGPHITGAMPSAGMPRMSGGSVFSNASHRSSKGGAPPPILGSEHPYPHAHPMHYPYPYGQPHGHHPMMHYPHQLHPQHHPHMAPPLPMQPHPSSAYHHQQQQQQYPYPMGYSEDAFGMAFFPTNDVTMEQSEGSCNVSDISGLSSSVTGDQRKQQQQQQQQKERHHKIKYHQPTSFLASPHATDPNRMAAPVAPATMEYGSAPMMDTTSSLPSFSDLLDDVDMASATSGKGSTLSVSSSTVAKLLVAAPMTSSSHRASHNHAMPPPSQSLSRNPTKRATLVPMAHHHPTIPMKENTGSCLSGKSGSCLSGKSELSLPSSCGTNISVFSDSFMAMNLSEYD